MWPRHVHTLPSQQQASPAEPPHGASGSLPPTQTQDAPSPSTRPGQRGQQDHGAHKGPEPTGAAVPGVGTKQVDAASRCRDGLRCKGDVPAQAPSAHKGPSDLIQDALPSPRSRPGPHPSCALPTGRRPPATPCPVTGSGRPSLRALTGPVLKPGLDPGSSCSLHPPTLYSTSPDPDAGTHPFSQRPPPPGPSLPGPQLYLPLERQPTRAPHHRAGHSGSEPPLPPPPPPPSEQPLPGPAPEGVLGPPQGGAGKEALPRGTGSAAGSVPTPRRGKRRGAGTLAGPGRPWADLAQGGTARSPVLGASFLPSGRPRGSVSPVSLPGLQGLSPASSHSGQPGFMTSQAEVTRGQCWAFHTSKCRPSLARRLPAVLTRTMPAGPRGEGM